jgi:crotonobetainyl-CoA:carnitine CoA-transferase CaiB-like acyl-CoA transferase
VTGPLEGVRVLELGSFIAGPFAGQLLADLGADVIKVEPPGAGDAMRRWGRVLDGRSIWWSALARNKRLVAVDLRLPQGQDIVRRIAETCDAVIENFTPGRLEEWGLGYEQLRALNPRLVLARVSGFGQTGPRAGEPGFGAIAEAMGGLRELMGSPDRPPARAAISLGDQISSLFTALGTVAAIRHAERTDEGQIVDVALYESVFALTESLVADFELTGYVRTRAGGALPGAAPSNAYPSADDKLVMIAANSDASWARLVEAMGRPDLLTDERYATHEARGERVGEVDELVGAWTRGYAYETLDQILTEAKVPHGLIYRAPDIARDPQYEARGMIQRIYDDTLGRHVPMSGVVPRLSRTPGAIRWPGADVGAHTHEVLTEMGLDEAERSALVDAGVIPPAQRARAEGGAA